MNMCHSTHYVCDRVRQHTGGHPLHYASACSRPQSHASQAAATILHASCLKQQSARGPSPALVPPVTNRLTKAGAALVLELALRCWH